MGGKLFAVLAWDEDPMRMSLKCPPERVEELRAVFPAIQPPAYFNKRHWNLIVLDGSVPDAEIEAMIDTSHELIMASLTKKARAALGLD